MLRLLLDTHAFVWCLSDVPRLAEGTRNAIAGLVILLYRWRSRRGAGGGEKGSRQAVPV